MGFIVWLIIGGIVGWLASLIMRTDAQQGVLLNIVVGIVGAFIAGLIFGGGSINQDPMDLTNILVSLVEDPIRRTKMGLRGREDSRQRFEIRANARRLFEFVRSRC